MNTPLDAEETEARQIACLMDAFKAVPDPRDPRGTRYAMDSLLALAVTAILCGCANPSQIAVWGARNPRRLRALGFRPPKRPRKKENKGRVACPNEDTLSVALARVGPEDMNRALARWILTQMREPMSAHIDGKALRGAGEMVLTCFIHEINQVAWQGVIGTKENELSALEQNLENVLKRYPNLALVTGDAAFGHKSIARAVIQEGRDYFLQLKAPHTTDLALATDAFSQITTRPALAVSEEKRGDPAGRNGSSANCGATRRSTATDTGPMVMEADGRDCGRSC
jgi:hypothetical protein